MGNRKALEALQATTWWNAEYDLPLVVPSHNPWIYMAYLDLLLQVVDGVGLDRAKVRRFFDACENPDRPGLFYRWPNKSGGPTSHDEIMGVCHFSSSDPTNPCYGLADRVLKHLDSHLGVFNSHGVQSKQPWYKWDYWYVKLLRYNVYRLPWLRPYLLGCADRAGVLSQIIFALKVLYSAYYNVDSSKVGPGPRLRIWLMADRMLKYPLCAMAVVHWVERMNKYGLTLSHQLAQEPGGVTRKIAPAEWKWEG